MSDAVVDGENVQGVDAVSAADGFVADTADDTTQALETIKAAMESEQSPDKGEAAQKTSRKDIYARRRDVRDASRAESEENDLTVEVMRKRMEMEVNGVDDTKIKAALMAEYGDKLAGNDYGDEGDEPGERVTANMAVNEEQTQDVSAALDSEPEYVEITVNGQKRFATSDEVREAGSVKNLQRILAADERFEQAAAERKQVDAERARLESYIADQLGDRASHLPKGGAGADEAPSSAAEIEALSKAVISSFYASDEDEAAKNLAAMFAKVQQRQEPKPASPPAAAPQLAPLPDDQARANKYFRDNYADLGVRPDLLESVRFQITEQQKQNPGADLVTITQKAADHVRLRHLGPSSGTKPVEMVEVRRERKRENVAPRAAREPMVRDAPEEKAQPKTIESSRKEQIAKLMASRARR